MITGQTHKKSIKHGGLSAVLLSSWQVLQTEDHGVDFRQPKTWYPIPV